MPQQASTFRAPAAAFRRGRRARTLTGLAVAAALTAGLPAASGFELGMGEVPMPSAPVVPRVLSGGDVMRYRAIFELQEDGRWGEADKLVLQLKDRLLMGHVLFQRYMHPEKYRSSYAELHDWMVKYRDHPDADRVHELALRRKPKKAAEPPAPYTALPAAQMGPAVTRKPAEVTTEREAAFSAKVYELVDKGQLKEAEQFLVEDGAKGGLSATVFDRARAELAMGLYTAGEDEKAYDLAAAGAERSSDSISLNHWIAGLAAFRLGRNAVAARHFEGHALSPAASPWNAAAGAYWAARVHLRLRRPVEAERWLRAAAEHPRTFYGLIARRALGLDSALDWSEPRITQADVDRVLALPGGRRAIALAQIGKIVLAEEELRAHVWKIGAKHARSLLAVADAAQLPGTAVRAGSRLVQLGDGGRDRALYPTPPWSPNDGFKLDRALIYAFMRQESAFDARAKSPVGARGLMQLMPTTASWLSDERDFGGKLELALTRPELNLALGQQFLGWLLNRGEVGGDLFKLAIAYNAGAGNLRKWDRSVDDRDDPLLFIESIPARETRIFVERVMANLWIYRQRMGQPNPSLDAVVAGDWPRYTPLDRNELMLAEDVKAR